MNMNNKQAALLILCISFTLFLNAQIMQSTIVNPVDKIEKLPKAPGVSLPLARVPEVVLGITRVSRSASSPAGHLYFFEFKATFKNLSNFQSYRWLLEEHNMPIRPLTSYMPIPPDSVRTGFNRDSSKTGPFKIWLEALAPNSLPLSSNKVAF